MDSRIQTFKADTLDEVIRYALQVGKTGKDNILYFRGENKDFKATALVPGIYRNGLIRSEHLIYREMQRFNDHEFTTDKTAFDKLARMQHYTTPTRMIDVSEDILSGVYFALDGKEAQAISVLYLLEVDVKKIKYYDSDAVSILANLAKSPLDGNGDKSKEAIRKDVLPFLNDREGYNQAKLKSKEYLLHDICEEKSYFKDVIEPDDIFSILAVKPKLTSQRIQSQKGAFLLYGLNLEDVKQAPQLLSEHAGHLQLSLDSRYHPLVRVTKILLSPRITMQQLNNLGVSKPYIYPELDRLSEYFKKYYQQ
ncbi:FRG domain-containing protein [Ectothiorhodospira lacustris]|uniref:FRG domain-containing protein n=1 Tax=Ectothiorhodospira lacustris TaxID=2899127 RepID=UPI001EE91E81|nr:FRG domain-containing protein [Ectothiorhodospira lacustris]MCG5510643.1 FRG domain-containing protein [Ectothiorhodospira lacustris]MCG5522457.1 FRG domain-containing protein [Ectothiorhodospira lacustris]